MHELRVQILGQHHRHLPGVRLNERRRLRVSQKFLLATCTSGCIVFGLLWIETYVAWYHFAYTKHFDGGHFRFVWWPDQIMSYARYAKLTNDKGHLSLGGNLGFFGFSASFPAGSSSKKFHFGNKTRVASFGVSCQPQYQGAHIPDGGPTYYIHLKLHTGLWMTLFAVYPAVTLLRRFKNRDQPRCACGYNLTGNTTGVCPECGTKFSSGGQS